MTSPIDSVGPPATLPADYDPSTAKVNTTGQGDPGISLDPEAFLQLLVAQLKYQDPTNPVDTSQFMNQTAMLSQVQTMNTMSDTLASLMTAQQTASATSMIGKAITFVDPTGKQSSGIVDSVSFSKGVATLHVGGYGVALPGVLAVADPVPVEAGVPSAVDGASGASGADDTSGAAGDASGTSGADGTSDTSTADDAAAGTGSADSAADPGPTADTDTGSAATDPGSASADPGATGDGSDTVAATVRPDTITA